MILLQERQASMRLNIFVTITQLIHKSIILYPLQPYYIGLPYVILMGDNSSQNEIYFLGLSGSASTGQVLMPNNLYKPQKLNKLVITRAPATKSPIRPRVPDNTPVKNREMNNIAINNRTTLSLRPTFFIINLRNILLIHLLYNNLHTCKKNSRAFW